MERPLTASTHVNCRFHVTELPNAPMEALKRAGCLRHLRQPCDNLQHAHHDSSEVKLYFQSMPFYLRLHAGSQQETPFLSYCNVHSSLHRDVR